MAERDPVAPMGKTATGDAPRRAWPPWLAPVFVLLVSVGYESLFIFRGINRLDESWQLYAAMRLHDGGVLYQDTLWVFPPGHVWAAWLAWWLDPPGLVVARVIYALFCVGLSIASYFLARRLMPQPFALLAALLVALAAPRGHAYQLLFGFRYLVLPVLALIALDRRLRGGGARWILAAGILVGISVSMRLTPAFSVACGISVALVASHRHWRAWLGDGLRFGLGILLATAPVLLWFSRSVGLPRLWQEVVMHPLAMLQDLPLPVLDFPDAWDRDMITMYFVALQFRLVWLFYSGYLVALAALWVRSRRRSQPFGHGLLLALTVFGAVFFVRSTGRSDEPHLDSVIPPACILVAHLLSVGFARLWPVGAGSRRRRALASGSLAAGVVALWIFGLGTDTQLRPIEMRPLDATNRVISTSPVWESWAIDATVKRVQQHTEPGDTILTFGPTPLFYILSGRTGPGYYDIVMPGTFLSPLDEIRFIEILEADPPDAVVWSGRLFDDMPSRALKVTAPRVHRWLLEHYERPPGRQHTYFVMIPRKR